MNNKIINYTIFDESLLGYAATALVPMAKAVGKRHPETRQEKTETEANRKAKSVKRERVYLHSIGRFSKLKKLRTGTYGD